MPTMLTESQRTNLRKLVAALREDNFLHISKAILEATVEDLVRIATIIERELLGEG